MLSATAQAWIDRLNLEPHVEGGWYKEMYRSTLTIPGSALPSFDGSRSVATHIYFLLTTGVFSAFHRIRSDEMWHFYSGDPISIYDIDDNGVLTEHVLGNDPGLVPFTVVHAGRWFGSRVHGAGKFALLGCSVSPGFDFADFELGKADELSAQFPVHEELIRNMTRI